MKTKGVISGLGVISREKKLAYLFDEELGLLLDVVTMYSLLVLSLPGKLLAGDFISDHLLHTPLIFHRKEIKE